MVEPIVRAPPPERERRPFVGYAMVWVAATLFAVNGTVAKVILASGVSSLRLSQVRSTGALVGLAVLLLLFARRTLRLSRHELPFLAVFGICGLAFVQLFYFLAIHRLPIGIALVIQYVGPLLVALWARYVLHERVRRRIWIALALSLAGLGLIVRIWRGLELDAWGVAAACASAVTFAVYVLLAERAVGRRDPLSLSFYGFLFASLFWAVIQPWWTFPAGVVDDGVSLLGNFADASVAVWLLMAWLVVFGTIVPFALVVGALRHVSATRVGILATLEPVLATLVAYLWLGESLTPVQLVGGGLVLGGIALAQSAR
jgi:drug/metabolite transporter (DMT)-like permease